MATHNQVIVDMMRKRVVQLEKGMVVRDERWELTAMKLRTVRLLSGQAVRS